MNPETVRAPVSSLATKYIVVKRAVATIFWVLGAAANLLGIYAFGEDHGWWIFELSISQETKEGLLMVLVGLGGPWALIMGGVGGAKLSGLAIKDLAATRSHIQSFVRVGFFLAMLHMAEVSAGLRIFPDHLSAEGFLKIVAIYLLAGFGLGVAAPLVIHAILKVASQKRKGRPTPRWSGRKPRRARLRRSP